MANQSPNQPIAQAAAGTLSNIVTGISGMKYRCLGLWGAIGTTGTMKMQSHTSATVVIPAMALTAGQPFGAGPVSIENGEGLWELPAGEGLDMITTGGGFNGFISGQWIPA